MSIYHEIIRYPSITEKNTNLRANENKYVFEVAPSATKPMIKKAVEQLFNVRVLAVNTMNVAGKPKRMGRFAGFRAAWKKAIVKIEKGKSIEGFGGV